MRERTVTTIIVTLIVILYAVPVQADVIKFRLSHSMPVASEMHSWAAHFSENLKKLSNSTLETEVIGGGVLGSPPQELAQGRAGKLDFWLIDPLGPMMAKEGKDFSVMFAPYLFKSQEHYRRFIKSDLFKDMMADAEQKIGIKFLGVLGDRAPRALASVSRPVTSPDDMKGLKIRLPQLPFVAEVWKEWGANPTQIKGGDLYQALQSGMVDGDDNGIDVLLERGLNEVLKYFTPINYMHSSLGIFMSGMTWAKLNQEQQSWVLKAVRMVDEGQKPFSAIMEAYLQKAKGKGMTVVVPDLGKFQASATKIIAKVDGDAWAEGLYKRIQATP